MDVGSVEHECQDVLQIIDVKNLPNLLNFDDEIKSDMTSLGTLMLLGQTAAKTQDTDDTDLQRLSLAYERLNIIPKILVEELGSYVKILDISNNSFENLDFLCEFTQLTSLICDRNNITSDTCIPYMPRLELLWLNHCKIKELYPWAKRLFYSCPNLKYLSLMGNDVAPSYLNGGNFYECLRYRFFMISLFPNLVHLDDRTVTEHDRKEAEGMYHRPLVERIMWTQQRRFPECLRNMSARVSQMLYAPPHFTQPRRNAII